MKSVIRISASDLTSNFATEAKLNEIVRTTFRTMFSEADPKGVNGIMASELMDALRTLGMGEAILEEGHTAKVKERNKRLFLVSFPSGVSFSGYWLQGQLVICCREYCFAFTQSEVYYAVEDWVSSSSFRCSQPGVRRLSADQLAILMREFAEGMPSLLEKWEQKLCEARKRAFRRKVDDATKALICKKMAGLGLRYLMEEQCHRMKLTIQVSKMNQVSIYLPYGNIDGSFKQQLPSVVALKNALNGLSKGCIIQGVERGRHWITGTDSSEPDKEQLP